MYYHANKLIGCVWLNNAGLSVVQRCNPDAVLLTHQNTMKRIGKGNYLDPFD
jgi:hypothetical protein